MEPITKRNAETHKMREKMATGMVYPTDTNESNQALSELSSGLIIIKASSVSILEPHKIMLNCGANCHYERSINSQCEIFTILVCALQVTFILNEFINVSILSSHY